MLNGNLAELLARRASEEGWYDKPAYYAPDVVTHGHIHDGGARLGEVLGSRGLSRGDRVLLCLPDSPELVQLVLACLGRGIVAFLANPDLHRDDHAFQERDTEPALVVTSGSLRDRFHPSGVVEAEELMSDATRVGPGDYETLDSGAPAYATYTSGTTGPPKAAIHRHADPLVFVEAMCRNALRLTAADIGLSSARMYFAYGLGNSVWFPLATGSSAVINPVPPVLDGIGSTEVGQTFVSNSVDEWRAGTLGKVLPPYEIRVVAADGATAESGVEGDLWVRGSSITPGYWNRSDPASGTDGWLETRDRVSIDDEGWVTYRCRGDDTEIIGGVNVNPRDIERLIGEHDAVAEAAVVGVKESTGASTLQAFLVPAGDASIDELVLRDIHRRLISRLSAFKVPHRFAVVERLPRTANGKLLRGALRSENPTKPIWELVLPEPRSDMPAHRVDWTAEGGHQIGDSVGDVTLKERLAFLQQERHRLVADAVCTEAAKMLVEPDPRSINRDLAFSELGFDSQMTVELSNRLGALTGLRLPETIGWDCGSISGLARYLETALSGSDSRVSAAATMGTDGLAAVEEELKKVEEMVTALGAGDRQRAADRLRALLHTITDGQDRLTERIQAASTPDEIFRLIDSEFGES